jgi:hypothetical protein
MSMSSGAISPLSYTTMSTRSDTTPASSSGQTSGGTPLPARGVLMWTLVTALAMHLDARWCVARRAREVVPHGGSELIDTAPGRNEVVSPLINIWCRFSST